MNARQEKFCIEFVRCGNATEAYKAAGYKPKSVKAATANSARMIAKDSIKAKIAELREEANKGKIMDAKERRELLTKIAADGKPFVAIKAIDVLNKMDGLYINKVEVSGEIGIVDALKEARERLNNAKK